MFGSSRQSHYDIRSGGEQARGFGEHRESCPSVQRSSTDWPSTVINTCGSSGVIRIEACLGTPRHLQSRLSWVLSLGPTPQRAVSSPVWSFADWTWSWGWLRCLRVIPLEMPLLSTVIKSPSLFNWVPLEIFLRLFQSMSNSHCWGFSLLPVPFLPWFFLLISSTIIYCLSQLQQFF